MDFLQTKRDEIKARLQELAPAVREYEELEAAVQALGGLTGNGGDPQFANRANVGTTTKRMHATRAKSSGTSKRGRPKGSGQRASQALAIIRETPGLTTKQIAEKMGIRENYLYRLLPKMASDRQIVQDEQTKGWSVTFEELAVKAK